MNILFTKPRRKPVGIRKPHILRSEGVWYSYQHSKLFGTIAIPVEIKKKGKQSWI